MSKKICYLCQREYGGKICDNCGGKINSNQTNNYEYQFKDENKIKKTNKPLSQVKDLVPEYRKSTEPVKALRKASDFRGFDEK